MGYSGTQPFSAAQQTAATLPVCVERVGATCLQLLQAAGFLAGYLASCVALSRLAVCAGCQHPHALAACAQARRTHVEATVKADQHNSSMVQVHCCVTLSNSVKYRVCDHASALYNDSVMLGTINT
jgi:hypothetical protein